MNWEEKEREREKRLVELLAGFLREHFTGKYGQMPVVKRIVECLPQ